MCAICTFQWLAEFLLWFLSLVDAILLDWGVAIILLVVVVRTLLHRPHTQLVGSGRITILGVGDGN